MTFQVITLTLGALNTNCYIVYDTDKKDAIIIDPADEGDFILQKIQENELHPILIVATHGHFDHILASTHLTLTLRVPFYMNKKDEFLLARMNSSSIRFTKLKADLPPNKVVNLQGGENFKLGKMIFKVLEAPGHTPGSICLYNPVSKILFAGDLIFSDGSIGRCDFKYSDKKSMNKSLRSISKLPGQTIVYSGHGKPDSLKNIRNLSKHEIF